MPLHYALLHSAEMELGWETLTSSTFKTHSDIDSSGFLPAMLVIGSELLLPLAEGHSEQLPELGLGGGEGEKGGSLVFLSGVVSPPG